MKKYTNYLVSVSLVLPISVSAVSLGNLTVKSYLNEPLAAYIRLSDLRGTPLSGIKIKLAEPSAFKRAGLERPYMLSKLLFTVGKLHGKPIVKITSIERVEEPFVTFMLDLTWAKGQYYRTYTILLDPPGYNLALDAVEHKPKLKPRRKKWLNAMSSGVKSKPITSSVIRIPMPVDVEIDTLKVYGPTREKDDLWQIAMRYKPQNVTIYQAMISILALNPDAFTKGNVNGLKTGVTLKIPNYKIMVSLPAVNSKLEIEAQSLAWKENISVKHVLQPPYIDKRKIGLEKSSPGVKTSKLPSLNVDMLNKKPLLSAPSITEPLSLKTEKTPHLTSKNNTQSSMQEQQEGAAQTEQVFDDFIPVPQILTKIVKQPIEKDVSDSSVTKKTIAAPKAPNQLTPMPIEVKNNQPLNDQLTVAASAIATVKESNNLLRDQVKSLLKQNELLKTEALAEKSAVLELKKKFESLSKVLAKEYQLNEKGEFVRRDAVARTSSSVEEDGGVFYTYLLLVFALLILSAGGAIGFLYLKQQNLLPWGNKESDEDDNILHDDEQAPIIMREIKPTAQTEPSIKDSSPNTQNNSQAPDADESYKRPVKNVEIDQDEKSQETDASSNPDNAFITKSEETSEALDDKGARSIMPATQIENDAVDEDTPGKQEADDMAPLEFEAGLSPSFEELQKNEGTEKEDVPSEKETDSMIDDKAKNKDSDSLELEPHDGNETSDELSLETPKESSAVSDTAPDNNKQEKRNQHAVKASTQLALAETYMSMDDYESAKIALDDVMESGNSKQKSRAKELLERMKDK